MHIVVKGGACELLVDGSAAGRGEEFQLDVTTGEHRLVCRTAGAAQERTLRVAPGAHEEVTFRISAPSTRDPRDRRR